MTSPLIVIPSLRPSVDGLPFPGTELPDLPAALGEVQRWIDSGEVRVSATASRWIAWPERPEFEPIYGPVSLNTGAAGIAWYSRQVAAVLDDDESRARAARAVEYILATWRDHADDRFLGIPGTGVGHYGGLAGIGAVLLAFAEDDERYRQEAIAIFEAVLKRRGVHGGRRAGWTGADALLGDGGVVIDLLAAADRLGDRRYLEAAADAGDVILAGERPGGDDASTWRGLDPALLGLPADTELDGFELGTVGIAFALARLAISTGEQRFGLAAARGARAVARAATTASDAAVLQRIGGTYSFGYCTGSSGVIRSFLQVYRATGDPDFLEWAMRFGRGILRSGVPGRQTPGNTAVLHQCCGSAAVLESFLGLWFESGDRLWLEAARAQGDDLLIRAVTDSVGRRWYSESHVLPTGTLKAEVGHQVGASGIALALLRLHAANLADAGTAVAALGRMPDDPFASTTRR